MIIKTVAPDRELTAESQCRPNQAYTACTKIRIFATQLCMKYNKIMAICLFFVLVVLLFVVCKTFISMFMFFYVWQINGNRLFLGITMPATLVLYVNSDFFFNLGIILNYNIKPISTSIIINQNLTISDNNQDIQYVFSHLGCRLL